jgi:hypothetical protein
MRLAHNGRENGAVGYLITDWGDNGHWQTLPISYLGFVAGAGLAWNAEVSDEVPRRHAQPQPLSLVRARAMN